MKSFLILIFLTIALTGTAQTDNAKYDKALADKLGADDYGMKQYVFVILKTGPAKVEDKAKLNELFRGHMKNIGRLADEGKLVVAGPFMKNDKNYRGLFIFNVKTVEEAKVLLDTDPAVKAGVFEAEMVPWYGSAALGEYLPVHEKIAKENP